MAIYGIGAFYGGKGGQGDISSKFLASGRACVGWNCEDAPSLYKLLKYIKIGDLIYIKAHPPSKGLIIKAVGIVMDDEVLPTSELGGCLKVKWVWKGNKVIGKIDDKYNIRNNTLYEEVNPKVQRKVIDLLLKGNA